MSKSDKAPRTRESETGRKKRVRLAPEVRREQILQAALAEFTSDGYAAASISRIAEGAGISKANVYVHFSSKEEIFEILLQRLLDRPQASWARLRDVEDFNGFIDHFVDAAYASMTPEVVSIIRLLIADAHRVPHLQEKFGQTISRVHGDRQALIDELVREGKLRPSPLTENFSIALTPFLYAAVAQMVFGPERGAAEVERMKSTHKQLLRAILTSPLDV